MAHDSYRDRLNTPPVPRIIGISSVAGCLGFVVGSHRRGQLRRFQFLAENAHRLPTTSNGWYFYHKKRNYVVALAGMKGGLYTGAQVAFWATTFTASEALIDFVRTQALGANQKDVLSTVSAGLVSSSIFCSYSL